MAWDEKANFKFAFHLTPNSSLEIWGIPGNFHLSQDLSFDDIQNKIHTRELLHFSFPNIESGIDFFSKHLREGILYWFEDPWVYFSSNASLKDRQIKDKKILTISPESAPKELKWVASLSQKHSLESFDQSKLLKRENLLLHVCCGPDAAGVVEQLKTRFDLTCY
jgi:hypothetical protein